MHINKAAQMFQQNICIDQYHLFDSPMAEASVLFLFLHVGSNFLDLC